MSIVLEAHRAKVGDAEALAWPLRLCCPHQISVVATVDRVRRASELPRVEPSLLCACLGERLCRAQPTSRGPFLQRQREAVAEQVAGVLEVSDPGDAQDSPRPVLDRVAGAAPVAGPEETAGLRA